jgi:predicted ATPase
MSLKRIEIKGLRGFEEETKINLAIPNGKYGSGLTILVGPNNSGKSSIIEAFSALSSSLSEGNKRVSFTEEMRNKIDDNILIRAYNLENGCYELRNSSPLRSETRTPIAKNFPRYVENIFVLQSRRNFDPYYNGDPFEAVSRYNYIDRLEFSARRGGKLPIFFSRIAAAEQRPDNFNEVMHKILDPLPKWELDRNGSGQYYMKFIYDDVSHISDGSGDGLLSIFFIVDALYDSGPKEMILIDEPELSLHPSLQKKLSKLFAEYARDRQIIIATHSPYFIDWNAFFNGADIIRVVKEGRKTNVYPKEKIGDDLRKKLERFAIDTHNTHVLGLDAREIFFLENNILLVEGQEDVIYYRMILDELGKELNGEFYGWGVGGADKMEFIARLLHELGYKKVIGLLDGNKKDRREKLGKAFPAYKFRCIPADDLLTKEERPTRDGLLDENYKIKDEYRDIIQELFDEIESEFKRSE